jgi:hypothetical protein
MNEPEIERIMKLVTSKHPAAITRRLFCIYVTFL